MAAKENFRRNLATAMEAKGLKKVRVAQDAQISRVHLDVLLRGDSEPGIDTGERLARAVGFPLVALLESPEIFSEAVLTAT